MTDGWEELPWVLKYCLVTDFLESHSLSMTMCHQHTVFSPPPPSHLQRSISADLGEACYTSGRAPEPWLHQISWNTALTFSMAPPSPATPSSLALSDLDGPFKVSSLCSCGPVITPAPPSFLYLAAASFWQDWLWSFAVDFPSLLRQN